MLRDYGIVTSADYLVVEGEKYNTIIMHNYVSVAVQSLLHSEISHDRDDVQ